MLTKRAIDALTFDTTKPRTRAQIAWDGADGVSGFGVRVYPPDEQGHSHKSFLKDYRDENGRQRRLVIGKYGEFTIDQARAIARKTVVEVASGANPVESKRQGREELKSAPTFANYAEEYLERARTIGNPRRNRKAKPKRTVDHDRRRLNWHILSSPLANRPLASITKHDVRQLVEQIGADGTYYEANRVLQLIAVFFESAVAAGKLPDDFVNPCRRIAAFPETPRKVYIKKEQMPRFLEAVEKEPSVYVRGFIKLSLMLGTRCSELLHATWDQVDLNVERPTFNLPTSKSDEPHRIPLVPAAVQVFTELHAHRMLGNEHIFPSPSRHGRSLRAIQGPWDRIRRRAGLRTLRIHDLRRTVGTWLIQDGIALELISKMLNHSSVTVTERVYAHLVAENLRPAAERMAEQLSKSAAG
jgi:integrase